MNIVAVSLRETWADPREMFDYHVTPGGSSAFLSRSERATVICVCRSPNDHGRGLLWGDSSLSDKYYIRLRGKVQGPFVVEKLQALARQGQFSRVHEVSADGKIWNPASNYDQLFPQAAPRKERKQAPVEAAPVAAATQPAAVATPAAPATDIFVLAPAELPPAAVPTAGQNAFQFPDVTQSGPNWFYFADGHKLGPLELTQLQSIVRGGQLRVEDFVWREDMPDWILVRDEPSLSGLVVATPASQATVGAAPSSMTNPAGLPTPPLAIASLVLAIAGMTLLPFVGSVLAVVFGHLALGQIKSSHGALGGRGLALAGAVMGYVEVAIYLLAGFVLIVWLLVR